MKPNPKSNQPMTQAEMKTELQRKAVEAGIEEGRRLQRPSNSERVAEFMDYGSPMRQMFVILACDRYAQEIIDNQEQLRANPHGFINPESLIEVAKNWQATQPPA